MELPIPYSVCRNANEMSDMIASVKSWQKDIKQEENKVMQTGQAKLTKSSGSKQMNIKNNGTENKIKERAENLKNKANNLYKDKKYKEAVAIYTQATALDSSNHILYANRAMAYIKLKEYEAANRDSSKSISINSNYVKAYLRRGAARSGLLNIKEAIEDYKTVLKLEPSNNEAKNEIRHLQKQNSESSTKNYDLCQYKEIKVVQTTNRELFERKGEFFSIPITDCSHHHEIALLERNSDKNELL